MDFVLLHEKETQLLNEWAAGCDGFIPDGVVNAEQYLASEIRLLYLLKEGKTSPDGRSASVISDMISLGNACMRFPRGSEKIFCRAFVPSM